MKPFFALFLFVGALLVKWLKNSIGSQGGKTGAIVGGAGGALTGGLVAGPAGAIVGGIAGGLAGAGIGDILEDALKTTISTISDKLTNILLLIPGDLGDSVRKIFTGMAEMMSGILTLDFDLWIKGLKDIFNGFFNLFGTSIDDITIAMKTAFSNVIVLLENTINGIIKLVNKALPDFAQIGKVNFASGARSTLNSLATRNTSNSRLLRSDASKIPITNPIVNISMNVNGSVDNSSIDRLSRALSSQIRTSGGF